MKSFERGFTLIELLVVIAIIGILSSIVLASLNTARNKAADVAIKSNLSNIRAQAEIQYDNLGYYGDVFAADACPGAVGTSLFGNTVIATQIADAITQSGAGGLSACFSTGAGLTANKWAIAVTLKSDRSKAHCSDSSGASKQIDNAGTDYLIGTLIADITVAGEAACGS